MGDFLVKKMECTWQHDRCVAWILLLADVNYIPDHSGPSGFDDLKICKYKFQKWDQVPRFWK